MLEFEITEANIYTILERPNIHLNPDFVKESRLTKDDIAGFVNILYESLSWDDCNDISRHANYDSDVDLSIATESALDRTIEILIKKGYIFKKNVTPT